MKFMVIVHLEMILLFYVILAGSMVRRQCSLVNKKGVVLKIRSKETLVCQILKGIEKRLRAVKMAEKFDIPVLMLIDTPGAYPGLGAEERGQSEAIAKNLFEFASVKVPMVSIVIGEGGSGGALAIGVADKLAMMRYSVFAVISPEGCSAILWNDPTKVEAATKAFKDHT